MTGMARSTPSSSRSSSPADPIRPRHVVLVVFDGLQSLDLTGPLEVFQGAEAHRAHHGLADPGYRTTVAASRPGPVQTSSGLTIVADQALSSIRRPIDTLVVAGGDGARGALADPLLMRGVARLAADARRVTSVCSGAFVLAEAGLLDGRRATTHWSRCAELARRYPQVQVEVDPIFVRDGHVATSAGVTAGMDLALALVAEDLGRDVALNVARHLVLFLQRPGTQSQFSVQLASQLSDRDEIRALQQWVADHPEADCSVEALADRAGHEPPPPGPGVRRQRWHHPGPLRRAGPPGSGSAPPGGVSSGRGRGGSGLRLRHGRDHAPRVRAPPGRRPGRLSHPIPHRGLTTADPDPACGRPRRARPPAVGP